MCRRARGSIGPRSGGSSPEPLEARPDHLRQRRQQQRRDVPPALSSTATSPALRAGWHPARWDVTSTIVTQQTSGSPPGSAPVLDAARTVVADVPQFRDPCRGFRRQGRRADRPPPSATGVSPNSPVSSSAASATACARSSAPELHSAAASTTWLLARCRAAPSRVVAANSTATSALRTATAAFAAGHRQLGSDPGPSYRQPVAVPAPRTAPPAPAASPRRPAARHPARRRRARSAHHRPPRGHHRRAPSRDRPNRGPGGASPAGAETTPVRCEPARPAGPTGGPQQRRKVGIRAAVAALSPGGDRTQPLLMRCCRGRQRPASGLVAEGGGQQV